MILADILRDLKYKHIQFNLAEIQNVVVPIIDFKKEKKIQCTNPKNYTLTIRNLQL
jgi:hypothetical protein